MRTPAIVVRLIELGREIVGEFGAVAVGSAERRVIAPRLSGLTGPTRMREAVIGLDRVAPERVRPVEVGGLLQRRHEMRLDVGRDKVGPRLEERARPHKERSSRRPRRSSMP